MFPVINRESVLSGFQWFFFIFCNTVVVPPTLLSAFHLPADNLLMLTQYAFLTTALACLVQAFCGHRRAIMEGPTGLWWGAILTFAVVPFSPFVSSIGLLTQTGDSSRKSFICGSALCLLVAIITPLTRLFCAIPLAISSAVMLVSYLPLLYSGLVFSQQITFTARNIYRLALPLFVGIFLMGLPPVYLQDLPLMIRPLLSNGLLVGILLAVLMENLIPWERIK
ncbi:purine/pyrimidine permease [Salmonella enterica]|nr:purine/pyrimidine permease [Salmonella enterica]